MMESLGTIAAVRARVRHWHAAGETVALVPTMGNLHGGHLRLVEAARGLARRVAVSVFVNPLQFGAGEDIAAYPRTLEVDTAQLRGAGVDLLVVPDAREIYRRPLDEVTRVLVPGLSDILCGAVRPGHFHGVATVVAALFNVVQPDVAVFGEKDYQQLLVIRRMAADLHLPVDIVGVPTVRDPDGLALSSRNAYLSAAERAAAPRLYAALVQARDRIAAGDRDYTAVEAQALRLLDAAGFRPDYVAIRRAADLAPPSAADDELIILAAAWLGGRTRLIDNLRVPR